MADSGHAGPAAFTALGVVDLPLVVLALDLVNGVRVVGERLVARAVVCHDRSNRRVSVSLWWPVSKRR